MKNILLAAAVFTFAVWVLSLVVVIPAAIGSARIDSWLQRAKDAGNPQQVAEFLGEYESALVKSGRADKYSCVFRYPGCYMPTYLRAVAGLVHRAEALAAQPPTESAYQMGLLNLEADLDDIEGTAFGVWLASLWGIWWLIYVIGGWGLSITFLLIATKPWDY